MRMSTALKWRLGLLSLSHLVNDFMNGILVAILPILQSAYHLSYGQLTALVLIAGVFAYLIQPILGYFADKRSRPWFLPLSTLFLGFGCYGMSWSGNFTWLIITVVVSALGSALYHPDANRTVYLMSPKKRGWAQSIFQIGGNTGMALAPITLWFLNRVGIGGLVWVLVLALMMGSVLLVFARGVSLQAPMHKARQQDTPSINIPAGSAHLASETKTAQVDTPTVDMPRRSLQDRTAIATLVTVVTCRAITSSGVSTFLPLFFIAAYSLTKSDVWIYTFVFSLGGALGTFTGGPLGDRIGQRLMIQISLIGSIPLALLIPWFRGGVELVLLFILGFVLLSTFAVTVVYAQDMMPGREGMASSLVIGLTGGISGFVIFGLGLVADHFGLTKALWIALLMPVLGGAVSLFLPRAKKRIGLAV
jgi:MFS transporter, FSR family, fosmidomycin resistance protein